MTEEQLLCYNRGCGQTYKESENSSQSCRFHPGHPVFHDAYKGWSCCNKKTTDFTEFLNIPGCTTDKHSNIKPEPPPEKEVVMVEAPQEVRKPTAAPMERPPSELPLVRLPHTIASSLKAILDKQSKEAPQQAPEASGDDPSNVPVGTSCKNAGCKQSFNGPDSNDESCAYHNGVPVFHEGMKFWSCCQRRTTDFDTFLQQVGCQTGKHVWFKPKSAAIDADKSKACRYDYHQTGDYVVVSIYSKTPDPSLSLVEINPVKLHALVTFGSGDKKEFELETILYGIVDVEKSSVTYLSTKTEISLKKAEPVAWKALSLSS